MASYVNPVTKQIYISQDISESGWIKIQTDLANSLKSVATKYITIENGQPREMTKVEKDAYDNSVPVVPVRFKPKTQIMTELWIAMTPVDGDTQELISIKRARASRWGDAMLTPSFQMLSLQLDGNDYTNARARANELVLLGKITQDDYDIFSTILPLGK